MTPTLSPDLYARVQNLLDDAELGAVADDIEEVLGSVTGDPAVAVPRALMALVLVGVRLNHDRYMMDPEFRTHVDTAAYGAISARPPGPDKGIRGYALWHAGMMLAMADLALKTASQAQAREK